MPVSGRRTSSEPRNSSMNAAGSKRGKQEDGPGLSGNGGAPHVTHGGDGEAEQRGL